MRLCFHFCCFWIVGSFGGDMGLTPSQDALLNLPPSQPDHHGDHHGAGNGAHNAEHAAQPDAQVLTVTNRAQRARAHRVACEDAEHCIDAIIDSQSCSKSATIQGVVLFIRALMLTVDHSTECANLQGRAQEGSMVSLMGQQADAEGGHGNGGAAAANGGEHVSLPGASAASAFQAVQPVQQSEHFSRKAGSTRRGYD